MPSNAELWRWPDMERLYATHPAVASGARSADRLWS
jgi:hypothetical protein